MNELMKVKTNDGKELRITSVELVDIINQFREIERGCNLNGKSQKPLMHKNFMAKIKTEVEVLKSLGLDGQLNFKPSSYVNSQNKEQPCYSLNRDGMLQMLNSESALVRYKTIEYINKLESELTQPKLPQTYKEALYALIEAEEEKERLILENKEKQEVIVTMQPKADYHDTVLNCSGLLTTTEIAKDLGMSAVKLNKILNEKGVQYKQGKTWILYSKHQHLINEGYCDYKITEHGQLLKWTELGRKYIIDLLKDEQ